MVSLEQMSKKTRSLFSPDAMVEFINSVHLNPEDVEKWTREEDAEFEVYETIINEISEFDILHTKSIIANTENINTAMWAASNEERIERLSKEELIQALREDMVLCVYDVLAKRGYPNKTAHQAAVLESIRIQCGITQAGNPEWVDKYLN